jgi:hypothetical protein
MFSINKLHNGATIPDYVEGQVLPVLPAEKLLGKGRYRYVIEELKNYAQLPEQHFELVYKKLLTHFAEFVQLIPNQFHGSLGGLLNMSLARGLLAVKQYVANYGRAELDALNCYAIFSAALLMDVSSAVVNQKVVITDMQGSYLTQWRPFVGSMCGLGEYYKLYQSSAAFARLGVSITGMLARQLMPESGFLWISSHWRLFADWLDAMNGEGTQGGRLTHIISLIKLEDLLELMKDFKEFDVDAILPNANEEGEKFCRWLQQGVHDESIAVNTSDALVHFLDEGIFVDKQLFKRYIGNIKGHVDFQSLYIQFGRLMGVDKKGGACNLAAVYQTESSGSAVGFINNAASVKAEGMRVQDSDRLLKVALPASSHVRVSISVESTLPGISQRASLHPSSKN